VHRHLLLGIVLMFLLLGSFVLANVNVQTHKGDTNLQGYTQLWVTVSPQKLNLTSNVGVASIFVANIGPGVAENTYVSLSATGCSLLSTDGERWSRNLTFFLGNMPVRYTKTLSVIVRCNGTIGSIIVTALSDNCDPVMASIDVQLATNSPSASTQLPITNLIATAMIVLALIFLGVYLVRRRNEKRKRKKKTK
jgi:hypothetical protein